MILAKQVAYGMIFQAIKHFTLFKINKGRKQMINIYEFF